MSDPKRPGRPPLDAHDHSVPVSLKIPSKLYERTCQVADHQRIKVPEVIRRALVRAVDGHD
jgi:hypothetical protein